MINREHLKNEQGHEEIRDLLFGAYMDGKRVRVLYKTEGGLSGELEFFPGTKTNEGENVNYGNVFGREDEIITTDSLGNPTFTDPKLTSFDIHHVEILGAES